MSLDHAVIDLLMQATRHGRLDFDEGCCISGSLLTGAVTSIGGRAVQYSHWNGFDVTTKAGTDKLKEDLLEKKPRVVWMTPSLYHTAHATIPIKTEVSSDTHEHSDRVSLALWSKTGARRFWDRCGGSTSLGRGGALSELEEQFRSGRTPGCQRSKIADGTLS